MNTSQETLLVTGATGANGTELLKLLSHHGIPARAMVRKASALADLPGVELVQGDFDDPTSLPLEGVDRAFLVTNSSERAETQQLAFVEAAKKAGVRHIVKLSQFAAQEDSPVRFLRYHARVEAAIRESGMEFTFLRPNLFFQGLLGFADLIKSGKLMAPIEEARVSAVDVRDIAAVALAAMTEEGHSGRTYTITGPESLSHADFAAALALATGHSVDFIPVSTEAFGSALRSFGMPQWQAEGLLEDYAHYNRGEAETVFPTVEEVTDQAPRKFADFARDYASLF
jgi:uncharacterized protein YbjT (DUF2867 family)